MERLSWSHQTPSRLTCVVIQNSARKIPAAVRESGRRAGRGGRRGQGDCQGSGRPANPPPKGAPLGAPKGAPALTGGGPPARIRRPTARRPLRVAPRLACLARKNTSGGSPGPPTGVPMPASSPCYSPFPVLAFPFSAALACRSRPRVPRGSPPGTPGPKSGRGGAGSGRAPRVTFSPSTSPPSVRLLWA